MGGLDLVHTSYFPRQRAELQRQLLNEFTQEKLLHIPGA